MFTVSVYSPEQKLITSKESYTASQCVDNIFKAINHYLTRQQHVVIRMTHGQKLILETTEKHFENERT